MYHQWLLFGPQRPIWLVTETIILSFMSLNILLLFIQVLFLPLDCHDILKKLCIFIIWLHQVLVAVCEHLDEVCGIYFLNQ